MDGQFDISGYTMSTDEGTGELVFTTNEQTQETPEQENQSPQTPPEVNTVVGLTEQINNLTANQQRQSAAIATLIQTLMNQQQQPQQEVEQEVLSDVFTDPDRGKNFLNVLTKQIETIIDNRMAGMQPLIQQGKLQQELQEVSSRPDFAEYAPAMHHILGINGQLSFAEAYDYAKQMGWKTPVQKQQIPPPPVQTTQQPNNVADINQRRNLPPKLDSSNAQLQTKPVASVKDALELAMEQLGA
jgi:hypothetical protein